jgi:hypothetical protein
MVLLKFQNEDLFSFLSTYSVNEKIIELLKGLRDGNFDELFTNQLNARHFRASVYEPCRDLLYSKQDYCRVVVYPDYISFFVPISTSRMYEVVVGVNDDGLLFSNIVHVYNENREWLILHDDYVRRLGKHDLFNAGYAISVYLMETSERIYRLFGYDTELLQPTSTIDVSARKVIRVQGDRTLVVEPFSIEALQRMMQRSIETYMRYMWTDTLLFAFVDNHITAYPDEFMNVVVRRFFWSSAPWVDAQAGMRIKTRELTDFLVSWFRNVANIYAEEISPVHISLDAVTPNGCQFMTVRIQLSTDELGTARVRVGYCNNSSLLLRVEEVASGQSLMAKTLIQDIAENLRERRMFKLARYFGNHKIYMENAVTLPFDYEPPDPLKFRMLEPATIRVGEDRRGWYYVDEKSVIKFEHPEHPPKEVRFSGPAFISFGSTNVAPEHIDLMNVLAISSYAALHEIERL